MFQKLRALLFGAMTSTLSSSLNLIALWGLVACDSSDPYTEPEAGLMNGGMSAGESLDGSADFGSGGMTGETAGEVAGASAGELAGVSAVDSAGAASVEPAGEVAGEVMGEVPNVSGETASGAEGGPTPLRLNGVWSTCLDEGLRSERHQYQFISDEGGSIVGAWRYQEERFGDGGCIGTASTNLVEEGIFTLSTSLEGARPIDLSINTRTITPSSESAAMVLRSVCAQDFVAQVPTDLRDEGCERLGYPPLSDCPVRYDLITLEGETLRLGQIIDGVDVCLESQRPNTLGRSYSP